MSEDKKILHDVEENMKKTAEATTREFSAIRTSRASVHLVENLKVDYYGTHTPLKQLAGISTPEARLIVIQPWDPSSIGEIEKAIQASDVGLNPNNDGKLIRLNVPPLTRERKEEIVKHIHHLAEQGRVSLRTARRDGNEHIKKAEELGKISEDGRFTAQEDIQKLTDKYTKEIDDLLKNKEKEILEV